MNKYFTGGLEQPNPFLVPSAAEFSPLLARLAFWLVYLGELALLLTWWSERPELIDLMAGRVGIAAYLYYGLAFALYSHPHSGPRQRLSWVLSMSASLLIFNFIFSSLPSYTMLPLQINTAMLIATVLPLRQASFWAAVQAVLLAWSSKWDQPVSPLFTPCAAPSYRNGWRPLQTTARRAPRRWPLSSSGRDMPDTR